MQGGLSHSALWYLKYHHRGPSLSNILGLCWVGLEDLRVTWRGTVAPIEDEDSIPKGLCATGQGAAFLIQGGAYLCALHGFAGACLRAPLGADGELPGRAAPKAKRSDPQRALLRKGNDAPSCTNPATQNVAITGPLGKRTIEHGSILLTYF